MNTEFETFRSISPYEKGNLTQTEPLCFNDFVLVKRYRISCLEITESPEIIGERLEKLWVESDNHHHCIPLMDEAKKIGYTFIGKFGEKRNDK